MKRNKDCGKAVQEQRVVGSVFSLLPLNICGNPASPLRHGFVCDTGGGKAKDTLQVIYVHIPTRSWHLSKTAPKFSEAFREGFAASQNMKLQKVNITLKGLPRTYTHFSTTCGRGGPPKTRPQPTKTPEMQPAVRRMATQLINHPFFSEMGIRRIEQNPPVAHKNSLNAARCTTHWAHVDRFLQPWTAEGKHHKTA